MLICIVFQITKNYPIFFHNQLDLNSLEPRLNLLTEHFDNISLLTRTCQFLARLSLCYDNLIGYPAKF